MAINVTTLSGAITTSMTSFGVASTTNIPIPNNQTGLGQLLLLIDQEFIQPYNTVGTVVYGVRGVNGTAAAAHANGAQVLIGLPPDFGQFSEIWSQQTMTKATQPAGQIRPAIFLTGATDAIDPTTAAFYQIKTGAVDAMTLAAPPVGSEGIVIEIVNDTLFAHTLTAPSAILANGTALKTVATFPALRGSFLQLRASNGVWQVLSSGAVAGTVTFA